MGCVCVSKTGRESLSYHSPISQRTKLKFRHGLTPARPPSGVGREGRGGREEVSGVEAKKAGFQVYLAK